jgi:hypothetical protein
MDRDGELWVNIVAAVVVKVGRRCGLAIAVSGMRGRRKEDDDLFLC